MGSYHPETCSYCGRTFNIMSSSFTTNRSGYRRFCSPKCYKESGHQARDEEEAREEWEAKKEAERKEKERWESLSKEEQEAELEAKRKEEEAELEKKQKREEFEKRLNEQTPYFWGVMICWVGIMIFFLLNAFSGKGNDFMFGMLIGSIFLWFPVALSLPGKLQDIIDPVDK